MTVFIDSLEQALADIDAVICDQWGVLHNGVKPYPLARATLLRAKAQGKKLVVISNSGKRAKVNQQRIANMGFEHSIFDEVVTSGETLWRIFEKFTNRNKRDHKLFGMAKCQQDLLNWAHGLPLQFTDIQSADAVLLMGLHEQAHEGIYKEELAIALARQIPLYCSNPDLLTIKENDQLVPGPGALAHDFLNQGGKVHFYGKPHLPIFHVVESLLKIPASRLLIVGDSLQHDVLGGHTAGWKTLFIQGGIYAKDFQQNSTDATQVLTRLCQEKSTPLPDYCLNFLQ